MRVALASLGSRGDVEPFVLFANALADRGHTVTLALDDGYLARLAPSAITASSLGALEVPAMIDAVSTAVRAPTPVERSRAGYRSFIGHRRDDLRARLASLANAHDLLVIGDSLAFVENGRLPWSCTTVLVWYTHTPDSEFRRLRDAAALHLVALPAVVATTDASLREMVTYTGFWFGPDRGALSEKVEAFLADGRPPMFLTMGSMAGFDGDALATAFCAAARSIGERAIVQRGWQQLATAGEGVLVVDEVNYRRLFPRCAAAFVHGGTGTVAHALCAGVPTAIVPLVADQIMWAQALASAGIGTIDPRAVDPEAIAVAMKRALDPAKRRDCAELAERVGRDGLVQACEALERLG